MSELLEDIRSRAQTVVLVTHDLEFAESSSDRWVLLAEGETIA